MRWKLKLPDPKKPSLLLDSEGSCYLFDNHYRVCFSNRKQRYYFQVSVSERIDMSDTEFQHYLLHFFDRNMDKVDVAKCVRCSKWNVVSGIFCPRCKEAIDNPALGSIELDVEL